MESRNAGLEGGARTYSKRAWKAARKADPAVTGHLSDAEWVAHHLINVAALKRFPELVRAAVRAGWRTDDESNVVPLPKSAAAQEKLRRQGSGDLCMTADTPMPILSLDGDTSVYRKLYLGINQ